MWETCGRVVGELLESWRVVGECRRVVGRVVGELWESCGRVVGELWES